MACSIVQSVYNCKIMNLNCAGIPSLNDYKTVDDITIAIVIVIVIAVNFAIIIVLIGIIPMSYLS